MNFQQISFYHIKSSNSVQSYKFSSEPPRILSKNHPFCMKFVGFISKEAFSDPDSHTSRTSPLSLLRIGQNCTLVTSKVV